jgi:hypothetical protein
MHMYHRPRPIKMHKHALSTQANQDTNVHVHFCIIDPGQSRHMYYRPMPIKIHFVHALSTQANQDTNVHLLSTQANIQNVKF